MIAFVAVNLIFFGSLISGTGVLYLIGNYAFFFILFAFLFIKGKAFLEGLKGGEQEIKKEDEGEYEFISAETIKTYIYSIEQCTAELTQKLKNITEVQHLAYGAKLIAGWYIIAVLGQIFEFRTLVWLGLNWLFAFSYLLENKGLMEKLHPTVLQATGSTKSLYKSLLDKVPRYAYSQQ